MPLRALNWALPLEGCGDHKVKYEFARAVSGGGIDQLYIVKVTLPSGKTYHSLFNEYGCYTYATFVQIVCNAKPKPRYRYSRVYSSGAGPFYPTPVTDAHERSEQTGYLIVETVLEGSATTYTIHKAGEEPKNE